MTAELDRWAARPVASPGRVGQATAVEQSRAVAEVQAAIVVAQQCPRNRAAAFAEMRISCGQAALAERAFFSYRRGGASVTGPSIHLARELARAWGNIQYGIAELRRDDAAGESEMLAFAWDVQTNARSSNTFIVPHFRDTKDGPKRLTDLRDVYEGNANAGARRVREAIFAVLPVDFVEEAKSLCVATLEKGTGEPLENRRAKAIALYGDLGIGPDRLAARFGPSAGWTAHDLAQLSVLYTSLQRGEVHADEEFPIQQAPVTVAELTGQAPKRATKKTAEPAPAEPAAAPAGDQLPDPPEEWK